jgi:hypothetical protein
VWSWIGVCRTAEGGDECGTIKLELTLDVSFTCECVLPAQRPVLPWKVRIPSIPGNNVYDTFPTGTWPDTTDSTISRQNIKMYLEGKVFESGGWIQMAQNRYEWSALVMMLLAGIMLICNLKKFLSGSAGWIDVPQNRDQWRALVAIIMNLQIL